jgi:hypothetical protein
MAATESKRPRPQSTFFRKNTSNGSTNSSVASTEQSPPEPQQPSEFEKWRLGVSNSVRKVKTLLKASAAPLPTATGDGSALVKAEKPNLTREFSHAMRDIIGLENKTIEGLFETFKDAALGVPMDDRNYLMESLVTAACKTGDSFLQKEITELLVTTLWTDLEHPPQTLLGDAYKFRQPDGSKNSYVLPDIGKTGMFYARTIQTQTVRQATLPDPGVLFDSIMARKSPNGTKHPNRISSMLFYLASIIIHDIFRTDHEDFNKSNTSSYLDLAPLYGSTWAEQRKMRTMKDGKIHPDCFSESRLLAFPPGVGAILIMFNRYHNYVVEQLAAINEDGRFNDTGVKVDRGYNHNEAEFVDKRDDDLFQTARLITCGLYINIILIDYVRTILNLNRTDDNWQLNPRIPIKGGPPVGTGNQCAAEFNLVYRWHSAVSDRDDKWTQQLFKELPLPDRLKEPGVDVSAPENMRDFLMTLGHMEAHNMKTDPWKRQWPALASEKLSRKTEGPYKGFFEDDDLAQILTESIEDCANAMGPQQVPTIMKAIEVLGIQQARTWKCATLNEMRKRFNLKPHESFEEVTDNKEVADALKHLYDTPDQIEMYPGLVVEDAKAPKLPGSGLCPSFTTSRAVLSDAVALVRGDRFYTSSYTPALLTNWGFQEASSDLEIDNGCVMYKLFLRTLPQSFDPLSIYVHYPMTIPEETTKILQLLGKDHLYTFDKPKPIAHPKVVFSYDAAVKIMSDQTNFKVTWGAAIEFLMGPDAKDFMLAGDGPANAKSRQLMEKFVYMGGSSREKPKGDENWLKAVREFYEDTTTKLLKEKSYKLAGVSQVDIIREVGNLAHVHFGAEMWSIPLKTDEFERGIFTESDLYKIMSAVFICVFFDLDPPKSFFLRMKAREVTQALGGLLAAQVASLKATGKIAENLIHAFNPQTATLKDYGAHMLLQMVKHEPNISKLVWGNIMGTAGGMVANQGQLFGQAMDYFFTEGKEYLPEINRLAKLDTPEADDELMHYLMEGARLNGETGAFRWVENDITVVDKTAHFDVTHHFKKGDKIMVNFKAAGRDPKHFPNPDALDLTRDLDSYLTLGYGPHQCLGLPMTRVALTTMLKVIGRLDNLRPAPVSIGKERTTSRVKKIVKEFEPGDSALFPESWHYHIYLTEDWDGFFPFPTSKSSFAQLSVALFIDGFYKC